MQTIVKKWFRDKDSGFLDNGSGPDITVHKDDLIDCLYLKVGASVDFECHVNEQGLIAKKVQPSNHKKISGQNNKKNNTKAFYFGVMT